MSNTSSMDIRQLVYRSGLSAIPLNSSTPAGTSLDVILNSINTIFANASFIPTPSVLMKRDANGNVQANNFINSPPTVTVTSGITTTLTVGSTFVQQFTGTTTQTVQLPAANTLANGQGFYVANRSTGAVTVNDGSGGFLQVVAASAQCLFIVTSIGTVAGTWDVGYSVGTALTNPMTSGGQIIYGGSGGTPMALNPGTAGQILLTGVGGAPPTWANVHWSNQVFTYAGLPAFGVTAATTTNVPTFNTSFASGQVVDGVTLSNGLFILIKNQTNFAFTGTIAGTASPVLITATNSGMVAVTLTFTGSNTINSEITTWNTANPTNTVALTQGSGTQTPSAGTITLGDLNGVYQVNTSGAPSREASYTTASSLQFLGVHVTNGTVNANTNWFENNTIATFQNAQAWSQNSTSTFTVPVGVNGIYVLGAGGGGGGGSGGAESTTGGNTECSGGSGGQGAVPSFVFLYVTAGDTILVTIGVGGSGGAGVTGIENTSGPVNGNPGTSGSNSTVVGPSYGSVFSGGGGGGGGLGTGGAPTTLAAEWTIFGNLSACGQGGTATLGVGNNGSAGGTNQYIYPTAAAGGIGQAAAQGGGRTSSAGGGGGGGSGFGIGGAGSNGNVAAPAVVPGISAANNTSAGGGGSGGVCFAGGQGSATTGNGGDGGTGLVVFYWPSVS